MESGHIVKAFDHDLAQIESLILEMGGLVETQIGDAVTSLITRDGDLAVAVRQNDKKIDALEMQIDEKCVRLIALRQPMAADLRSSICALKVSTNLERIGDYAKNIAKRGMVIAEEEHLGSASRTVERMGKMVRQMVTEVLDAYMSRDTAMAEELRRRDEDVDHMHNTLFRELLTYMAEEPRQISACMHLLFIAKNLERMGDHVTGIAEQIIYLVAGALPDDDRPRSDILTDPEAAVVSQK